MATEAHELNGPLVEQLRQMTVPALKTLVGARKIICVLGYWSVPDRHNPGMFHPLPDDIQERLDKHCKS